MHRLITQRRQGTQRPTPHAGPLARLGRRLRHFTGPGDVATFLAMGLALATMGRRLARHPLPALLDRAGAPTAPTDHMVPSPAALARATRLARYADFWLRSLRTHNPCLRRSLVLFPRLRRAGLPVVFCLGVRNDRPLSPEEQVTGHAWLELDGRALFEPEGVAHYVPTFRYPASAVSPSKRRPWAASNDSSAAPSPKMSGPASSR
ncbi:lasso peptide biosynthesis B2 protein [uncultured Thiohalocapsa sp.]|uniref:lasso peptide biosynthesis B2 protein n=1 Tax=uncultured Thiohalocapsa sp. TaxID=768990 RepID=UPI0025DE9344|nr:lasso peptide biosynthesis B2 protein [uncultured Thiohalocapsa sp.]